MKLVYAIAALMALSSTADAFTSTRCYWVGSTYTCTSTGSGGISTTRCYTIGNTVRCTSY